MEVDEYNLLVEQCMSESLSITAFKAKDSMCGLMDRILKELLLTTGFLCSFLCDINNFYLELLN